ncbi:MAG TPA: EscU/YscU/HrcU family type III secretion system export apparatus switch protein [Anaerolineaceae bacterium]
MYSRFRKPYADESRPARKKATALGYEPEKDEAPRVLATGRGAVAEKIISAARAAGIPIQEDPLLASALEALDIDDVIPPELYAVVAEVFAYIYRIREKHNLTSTISTQSKGS